MSLFFGHFLYSVFYESKLKEQIPQLIAQNGEFSHSFVKSVSSLNKIPTYDIVKIQISTFEGLIYLSNSMHLIIVRPIHKTLLTAGLLTYFAEHAIFLFVILAQAILWYFLRLIKPKHVLGENVFVNRYILTLVHQILLLILRFGHFGFRQFAVLLFGWRFWLFRLLIGWLFRFGVVTFLLFSFGRFICRLVFGLWFFLAHFLDRWSY